MNFFILDSPLRFRSNFPSANKDGSRRHVSPQARGGGTGGREVRTEHVSSVSCARGELPGEKMARHCPAGIMADGTAGTWQERGGQGQEVAQQSGSVWQHVEAHSAMGTGCTAAGAIGAAAKLKSSKSRPANLIRSSYGPACGSQTGGGSSEVEEASCHLSMGSAPEDAADPLKAAQTKKIHATKMRIGSRKGRLKRIT
jgi:hypothetical protein